MLAVLLFPWIFLGISIWHEQHEEFCHQLVEGAESELDSSSKGTWQDGLVFPVPLDCIFQQDVDNILQNNSCK